MTPEQLFAARALLRVSRERLAAMSDVSVHYINRFEQGRYVTGEMQAALRRALEVAGVTFASGHGGVPTVGLIAASTDAHVPAEPEKVAEQLIEQYGARAMREAVKTVREMKLLGDDAGVAAWEEVARAVQRQKYRRER